MHTWKKRLWFLLRFHKSVPFLIDFFESKEVNAFRKLFYAGLIAGYVLFPFDIIPDFILTLGWIDDIGVAVFIFQHIVKKAPQSLREKHGLETNKRIE